MDSEEYDLALVCADIIEQCTRFCYDNRPSYDDTPLFEAVAQGLKAKLSHTEQRKLVWSDELLTDLARPFFNQTDYAVDKKIAVKDEDKRGKSKLKDVWVPNGTKTASSIYTALLGQLEKESGNESLQWLCGSVESLASKLPERVMSDLGVNAQDISRLTQGKYIGVLEIVA